ncbi:MAG TPA: hypothetical protein VFA10_14210 [Ktedonobacteraceae bacterium]|nr:hypothetical protein [Ktedonobacteraceae bacterium]
MAQQPIFSDHLPVTYDLGAHLLIVEGEQAIIVEKGDAETTIQELHLDREELYKLLITLQILFA